MEAAHDPSSGLTYPALIGQRKQSVIDAKRLFNPDLAKYMRVKGYNYEAMQVHRSSVGVETSLRPSWPHRAPTVSI